MRTSSLVILYNSVLFGAAVFSTNSSAASFDLNLSNKSAQMRFASVIGGTTMGRTETSFGFLYNDEEKYVIDIGLLVIDVAGSKSPGLELGVGPKFYFADGKKGEAIAIGLGGKLRYKIPAIQRLNFSLEGYYAPDIVAFANADNMYEVEFRTGYEILPTADIYAGYRRIRAKFDLGDETLDESIMFGFKLSF
ncbi:YfaZ family outer membrane protein [Kaarinaea lacus]